MKNDQLNYQEIRESISTQGAVEHLEGLCGTCQTLFNIKTLQILLHFSQERTTCPLKSGNNKEVREKDPDLPDLYYFLTEGWRGALTQIKS